MEYIKTEFKKLGSICLILVGAFLIIEHTYTYGGIEFWDILGHEWFGILFILAGILTANKWGNLKMKEGLKDAWKKIKYVFSNNGKK